MASIEYIVNYPKYDFSCESDAAEDFLQKVIILKSQNTNIVS